MQGTEPRSFTSAPVKTATTPGRSNAGLTLRLLMRAAACGLRTMQAWCMPGILMSSTYVAVPVMRRGSSRRRIFLPTRASCLTVVAMALCSCFRRGGFHRVDDMLIAGAPANVAFEAFADLGLGGAGVIGEQLLGGQDHSRRAKSALQPVLVPEGFLQRVEFAVDGQAFNRGDLAAVGLQVKMAHDFTALPSSRTVHAPQVEVSHPICGPVKPAISRR